MDIFSILGGLFLLGLMTAVAWARGSRDAEKEQTETPVEAQRTHADVEVEFMVNGGDHDNFALSMYDAQIGK